MKPENLILALDVETPDEAMKWVTRLKSRVGCFKIGLQLFTYAGPDFVRKVRKTGVEVFLDLKLCDIPNTVAKAIESIAHLDVKFLTIHTLGGPNMISAAVKACPKRTTILGVTVLTSLDDEDLKIMGFNHTTSGEVLQLARVAKAAGLNALVCSPLEIEAIRHEFSEDFTLVTPGVRPAGSSQDDQSRVTTPEMAIQSGSNYVVMGRPILKAENPESLLDAIYGK